MLSRITIVPLTTYISHLFHISTQSFHISQLNPKNAFLLKITLENMYINHQTLSFHHQTSQSSKNQQWNNSKL